MTYPEIEAWRDERPLRRWIAKQPVGDEEEDNEKVLIIMQIM